MKKMKDFEMKTKVYFGENALDHLLEKDSRCALVVADPFTVKSGLIELVTSRLEHNHIRYKVFDDARSSRASLSVKHGGTRRRIAPPALPRQSGDG